MPSEFAASRDQAKTASSIGTAMAIAILFRGVIFSLGVLSIYTAEGKLNPDTRPASRGSPGTAITISTSFTTATRRTLKIRDSP